MTGGLFARTAEGGAVQSGFTHFTSMHRACRGLHGISRQLYGNS
ncbi:hypothetical protein PF003_g39666 [Phytophthora fragariae]|nr:hypothetical protein PF003_g39666 [Phytophthora fragariae]